jgi:hypothetical protein
MADAPFYPYQLSAIQGLLSAIAQNTAQSASYTPVWGDVTGLLSNQTDLSSALAGKENSLGVPSTNGFVLSSTTSGVRSWVAQSGGGGGGTPGGSNYQVQFNNSTAFGGIANGSAGTVLTSNGTGAAPTFQVVSGAGNVVGPVSATQYDLAMFADTTGKVLSDSGITTNGTGGMTVTSFSVSGTTTFNSGLTGLAFLTSGVVSAVSAIPSSYTATTQSTNDSSAKIATTAFVNPSTNAIGVVTTTATIPWATSTSHSMTLTGSDTCVVTFTGATDGVTITVAVTTASGAAVTWPTVKWTGGTVPTQSTSGIDFYTFKKVGSIICGAMIPALS